MTEVPTKVAGLGLIDFAVAAGAKIVSSRIVTPLAGGQSALSAGAKAVAAILAGSFSKNRYVQDMALGVGIDAAEDGIDLLLGQGVGAVGAGGGVIEV